MTGGRGRAAAAILLAAILSAPAAAAPARSINPLLDGAPDAPARFDPAGVDAICGWIEQAAEAHHLPKPFFARLIWKESRFDIKAVSPVGAEGVAQFMPGTAKLRALADPFDPSLAIPASAAFLADLRLAFGNLGLAAAAYNGGPDKVARWLKNRARLAAETHDYVQSITGRPVDWFRRRGAEVEGRPLAKGKSFAENCREMRVIATRAKPRPPWGVVVAGGRNYRSARIAFERARRRAPQLMNVEQLHIFRRPRRRTGPVYFAMLGANSRGSAQKLCLKIRRAGANCRITQN